MRISESGVLSSCDTLAIKSLFMREARRSATTASHTMPKPTAMMTVDNNMSRRRVPLVRSHCARNASAFWGII